MAYDPPAIEYDAAKNRENRRKHGVPLSLAALMFERAVFETIDDRFDYGETRWNALGLIEGRVLHCTYTWRGKRRRIISLRKATKQELNAYFEATRRQGD